MAKTISHSFAVLIREILFLHLEHKIHIFSPPFNAHYIAVAVVFGVATIVTDNNYLLFAILTSEIYRKIPLISPGLIELRKGFWVGL